MIFQGDGSEPIDDFFDPYEEGFPEMIYADGLNPMPTEEFDEIIIRDALNKFLPDRDEINPDIEEVIVDWIIARHNEDIEKMNEDCSDFE